MTLDEPKTLGERYSTAIQSPNLRVQERESGAADLLIAAGWCDDTLGARLYRLRAEFDSLKASMSGTGNNAVTDKVLILLSLKSLDPAKEAVGQLAIQRAIIRDFKAKDALVLKLAGRAIDYFLDGNCPKCTGRRLNRGSKDAVEDVVDVDRIGHTILCRPCSGTGKRPSRDMGANDIERDFVAHLIGMLEEKMIETESAMRRNLR